MVHGGTVDVHSGTHTHASVRLTQMGTSVSTQLQNTHTSTLGNRNSDPRSPELELYERIGVRHCC